MGMRHGYTLIEVLAVLLLLAVLLSMAVPPVARWRDAAAVNGARDELAARLAWTRIAAASQGGAALVLELPRGRYRVELADGRAAVEADLASRFGVVVETAGGQDSVVLRYDALGIGRMAGQTLLVRRGGAVSGLVVSPYGRFRRW
jgi:prepilin-type N-terminal cleavage/methylation domain-containing protein